ncbi:MAG: hypothetical protein ACJ8FS_16405 [Sphingomicrobium sp.]
MTIREESNEAYLKRRVKESGGETRKVKWVGRRGAPDRLCAWPGRAMFVEVKEASQPWGLRDHQAREHERMRSWGLTVVVLSTRAEIDEFIIFARHEC